jgi:hypothetical protein
MYTIAKRRGIRGAWLAWIPVANTWLLGCVSDQFQYLVKGKTTNRRIVMLILALASVLLSFIGSASSTFAMLAGELDTMELMVPSAINLSVSMLSMCVSVAAAVFHYIALYDVYTSMNPANNVLFLVFSILFNITEPFFIFCNRNKELGMPPRRPQPPMGEPADYQPPVEEPWKNGEV